MKRTVHKFTALLFISTITFLWSTRESTTNLEKIDLSPEVESDERYFNKSHSVWPKLAGLKISSIVDESRPNFRPWLDFDGSCSKFRTHFAKNDTFQPPVYLTSYPGSGNTWTRYLIDSTTGFFSYGPDIMYPEMVMYGFYGNTEKNEYTGVPILVKTHTYNTAYFKSTVVIMRNPFESMVSFRKLETVGKHENPDEVVAFNAAKWSQFKKAEIGSWYKHALSYLKKPNNKMHILQYDELVKDTRKELVRLLDFLEFPFDPRRLECALKYKEGKFKRKKSRSMINFPFTKEETAALETAVCHTNYYLHKLNLTAFNLQDFTQTMKRKFSDPDGLIPDPFCAGVPDDEYEAVERVKEFLKFQP